jgi:ribosomal protein S18 acetylase RimI-like enzyme
MSMDQEAFRPVASEVERQACARMMASMDPWVRLGRDYATCLRMLSDPQKELTVAAGPEGVDGFIMLDMHGPFAGYIQLLCVRAAAQRHGLGQSLVAWAEERIHRVSPNVFICVSSFNARARALYERLGFECIGTLKNYVVPGYDEILLRKSIGPWAGFKPSP